MGDALPASYGHIGIHCADVEFPVLFTEGGGLARQKKCNSRSEREEYGEWIQHQAEGSNIANDKHSQYKEGNKSPKRGNASLRAWRHGVELLHDSRWIPGTPITPSHPSEGLISPSVSLRFNGVNFPNPPKQRRTPSIAGLPVALAAAIPFLP